MTDNSDKQRPADFPGENEQTDELAPENENESQRDDTAQAQTVADEALKAHRARVERAEFLRQDNPGTAGAAAPQPGGGSASDKAPAPAGEDSTPDVVDLMNQMDSSGGIDNSAYAGSPNHDDNPDKYGRAKRPSDVADVPDAD